MDNQHNTRPQYFSFTRLLDESVPAEIQRAMVGLVETAYAKADQLCDGQFDDHERKDVQPFIRRAYVETGLAELPDEHAEISGHRGENAKGNSFRYVRCGKIVITASSLNPNQITPRPADFRDALANNPNQIRLFPEAERERQESLEALQCVYAILTHRPSARDGSVPASIAITFVDQNCRYIDHVELIGRHELVPVAGIEEVADELDPKLRTDVETIKSMEGA